MSKIKMPGFTAEASLCKMSENYHMNGTNATSINGREILPQYCYRVGLCKLCCWDPYTGHRFCYYDCA
jgi:hypothetical protein